MTYMVLPFSAATRQ